MSQNITSHIVRIPENGTYGNNEETETCLEIMEAGQSWNCWRVNDDQFLRVLIGRDGYVSYEIETAQRTVDNASELLNDPPTLSQVTALKMRQ